LIRPENNALQRLRVLPYLRVSETRQFFPKRKFGGFLFAFTDWLRNNALPTAYVISLDNQASRETIALASVV
jgi:hypothetical protein